MIEFIYIESEEHLNIIRELFNEYVTSLGFELDFQDYEKMKSFYLFSRLCRHTIEEPSQSTKDDG